MVLFLSETVGGRVHDKRIADATPYPLPAGSRLLQDLGFMAFTLPDVEILMPMKKPRGQRLTPDQQRVNRSLNERRLRIEHVNSSIKRCRIVKDRLRLWKHGIRDLVMELCCALHNFRVRLGPWQQMINRDKLKYGQSCSKILFLDTLIKHDGRIDYQQAADRSDTVGGKCVAAEQAVNLSDHMGTGNTSSECATRSAGAADASVGVNNRAIDLRRLLIV